LRASSMLSYTLSVVSVFIVSASVVVSQSTPEK